MIGGYPSIRYGPSEATVFDDESTEEISADDLMGEYPAVQYVPPEFTFHIDILTRLGDAFRFSDLEVDRLPFPTDGDTTPKKASVRHDHERA